VSERADEVIELYGEGLGERQRRDPFEADEGGPSPERRHGLSAGAWSGYAALSPP
jgi:hypothetical protein